MRRVAALLFCLTLGIGSAYAVTPDEMLGDPALEARARALSAELRCMICQNQSIDDSDAPLAHDLRVLLRERILAGDTDEQVIDFLVARYGEFILLKPRFSTHTFLLWSAPIGALIIGAGGIAFALFRRRTLLPRPELTPEEQERLASLVGESSEASDRGEARSA